MDCRVVLEAAMLVYGVETPDAAVRIAIAKTGKLLNPELSRVEISVPSRPCPHCGGDHEPAFLAAGDALVALALTMEVFTVTNEQHAERIALTEIGQQLPNIPLTVSTVTVLATSDDEQADADNDQPSSSPGDTDEDDLPDFEDLFE